MADDGERLVVMLEARIRDFEKNMQKAERTGSGSFRRMQTDSRTATSRMQSDMVRSTTRINQALATTSARIGALGRTSVFSGFAAGAISALAPILSITAALSKASSAVSDFDKIAKSAKATGLDSNFYQELAYGADLAGVDIDALNASMIAFIRNSGLAAVGQGELAGKLKELNPELLKALQTAKTQEERFRLVADAVKAATSETEKAAIASAAFGRNGAKMVELLKDGADGFDRVASEARRLGIVIDRDLLARAEQMNDELSTATRIMSLEFSKALIDLAPFLISTARLAGDVAGAIRSVVDAMRGLQDKSKAGLLETLAEKEASLKKAETSSVAGFILRGSDGEGLVRLKGEITTIKAELKSRAIDELRSGLTRQKLELQRKPGDQEDPESGGSKSRGKATEAALREAAAVKELIADLEAERDSIGMSATERRTAESLRRAGAAATDEERQNIIELIAVIDKEREAQAQLNEATEYFKDLAADAFSDLVPKIETGNQALDKFLNTLIETVAQAALLGQGPLSGLFGSSGGGILGSLFGGLSGGFTPNTTFSSFIGLPSADGGGYTGSGSRSGGIDGKGGFLSLLHPDETVIDHTKGAPSGGGNAAAAPAASGDIYVTITNVIDATGADSGELQRTQRELVAFKRDLPVRIITTIKDAQKQRVL